MAKTKSKKSKKKTVTIWVNKYDIGKTGNVIGQLDKPVEFLCNGSIPGFHFIPFKSTKG